MKGLILLLALGCTRANPEFLAWLADGGGLPDAGADATTCRETGCESTALGVCDDGSGECRVCQLLAVPDECGNRRDENKHCAGGECVECTVHADCGDSAQPNCDSGTHRCFACVKDEECAADLGACDEGRCLRTGEAVVVAGSGSGAENRLQDAIREIAQGGTGKIVLREDSIRPYPAIVVDADRTVRIFGTTRPEIRNSDGTVIEVIGNSSLFLRAAVVNGSVLGTSDGDGKPSISLFDVEIHGAKGAGVLCTTCAAVNLDRCHVHDNTNEGLKLGADSIRVRNSLITENMRTGVVFETSIGAEFIYNTVAGNKNAGVDCKSNLLLSFNILWGNTQRVSGHEVPAQSLEDCEPSHGINQDDGDEDPLLTTTFHIPADSPARSSDGGPTSAEFPNPYDIAGDPRDSMPDIGADEYAP